MPRAVSLGISLFGRHTFLEQNSFEQRIFVSEHKTFVRRRAMALLKIR